MLVKVNSRAKLVGLITPLLTWAC